ncbi:MAG: hypothetical protein M0Z36_05155 [Thermaerobacter sp.]|nr:hypothetical protein [Thermaerobacter sp.]
MDAIEKKRLQNRERVHRFFEKHGEVARVGMVWPRALLKRIDEAAARLGVSRRAWILGACEKALAKVEKKTPISPTEHRVKARTTRRKRRAT